jgi:hypothetical protein
MQVNCAGMSFLKPAVELTPDDCSQVGVVKALWVLIF